MAYEYLRSLLNVRETIDSAIELTNSYGFDDIAERLDLMLKEATAVYMDAERLHAPEYFNGCPRCAQAAGERPDQPDVQTYLLVAKP